MRSRWPAVLAGFCALGTLVFGLVPPVTTLAVEWPRGVLHLLVLPTEPYVRLPALALLVLWCLPLPRDALFVVLAPALALAVNTWVLKPLFGRWKGDTLVYPSGHTVSFVAIVVVVCVLTSGRARVITAVVGAVLLVGVAVGMVGLGYHYLTDVVGGTFFAVFAVLVVRGGVRDRRPTTLGACRE